MKISIEKKVFENLHADFFVGCIVCSGINNKKSSADSEEMLRDMEEYVLLNFNADTVKTHHLVSAWNAATAHYGEKFHHYHTPLENMIKSILDRKQVPPDNVLIDLVHFFSLKHIVPFTAIDLRKVGKKLLFTLQSDDVKNELIFRDEHSILVRKFAEAKLQNAVTEKTTDALIYVEGVPPLHAEHLGHILQEVGDLVKVSCGGTIKRVVLTKNKLSAEI